MKSLTKLSFITVAVLGIVGCGGGGSGEKPTVVESGKINGISESKILGTCNDINENYICDKDEVGEIEVKDKNRILILLQDSNLKYNGGKFSLAFDRNVDEHELLGIFSKEDDKHKNWIEILSWGHSMVQPIYNSIISNLNSLGKQGVSGSKAQQANIKTMSEELVSLQMENFENDITQECKENETCIQEAINSIESSLTIDKEEAYALAGDIRGDENPLVIDGLVKEFTCEAGEILTIQHYGIEDLFDTSNGIEHATPSNQVAANPNNIAYNNNVNADFADYDEVNANRLFAENIVGLPIDVTKGRIYIGLKSNGTSLQGNDTMSLGNIDANATTMDIVSGALTGLSAGGWSNQSVNTNNPTTDIYWNDFSNVTLNDNTTLLSYANTRHGFDVTVQDDTSVDFITVATCSNPDPIKEVTAIVNKFECAEKETLIQILGGTIDAFNPTADSAATPRNALETMALSNTVYSNVADYDYTAYDHHFVDTLDIATYIPAGTSVTKAELNVGYKVIGSSLASNDAIYVGDYSTNHAGGHLYDNNYPIIPQGWSVHNITNYGQVAVVNLFDLNNTTGTGNVLNTMTNQGYLDIYVQDDTAVDFAQVNLCVSEPCGKVFDINLTQASQWSGDAFAELEPSTLPATDHTGRLSWAPSMRWFDFSGNNQNDNNISLEICACDNIELNISRLKADNSAKVYLDNTLVVDHHGIGQSTFIEDAWQNGSGITGSGTASISIPTGTPQTHTLTIAVHDSGVVTGLAVEGSLRFRGYLGACIK